MENPGALPPPMTGTMSSCEFVEDDDPKERKPGTYISIRLDADCTLVAGRVRVEYVLE